MNFNFIITLVLLTFLSVIFTEGKVIHYCIKRINGKEVYVHDNMHFNSYREMMDYALYGSKPTTTPTPTTLLPTRRIKIDSDKLNKLFLKQTNKFRKLHRVKELTFNPKIAKAAEAWAKECAKDNQEKYDYDRTYNTNYQGFPIDQYKNAIKNWYAEEKVHNYTKNFFTRASRHFSLMVFKPLKEMGCGFAQGSQQVFVVCKYSPPQGLEGGYIENVLRPRKKN